MDSPGRTNKLRVAMLLLGAVARILTLSLAAAQSSSSPVSDGIFQDDRIRVAIPSGWTAREVTTTDSDQHVTTHIGIVLSKGKYRLYLLTHYGQASGVEGGRFSEVAEYVAPWMSIDDPSGCFDALKPSDTPVTNLLSRVDLYFDSASESAQGYESCRHLHSPAQQPIWFGSYFSPADSHGFFLTFPLGQPETETDSTHQMAFTVTFSTLNPNDLPGRRDAGLQAFLRDASAVVRSIQYRR